MALLDDVQVAELRAMLGPRFDAMVARLAAQVHEALAALDAARAGGDRDALARTAHRLKGSAGALGAHALGEAAGALEHAARDGRDADTATARDALAALVAPTLAALRAGDAGDAGA